MKTEENHGEPQRKGQEPMNSQLRIESAEQQTTFGKRRIILKPTVVCGLFLRTGSWSRKNLQTSACTS